MAEFEIKVQELDAGGREYVFPITSEWLGATLADSSAEHETLRPDPARIGGEVRVWAEKSGEDVIVRGRMKTGVLAECSRCLADAPVSVDAELTALFSARGADFRAVADEEELSPEEIDREFYVGDKVELDELVREQILLEVPMQPLCSETCAGLEVPESIRGPADLSARDAPVHDGKKIDPRLAPLLSIMNGARPSDATDEEAPTTPERPKPGRSKDAGKKPKH